MVDPSLIPALDAAGLPGPVWLFHSLLVFTFFLHLLFINLTLGGTLLAAVAHLASGGRQDDPRGRIATRLTVVNGYGISLTITTGIAPLLFIQVLYQQFFYAGAILIGGAWLALVLLLMLGYYSSYLYKFKGAPERGRGGGVWIVAAALLFLVIAGIHVAVHLVHTQPGQWASFAADPWLVLADPTYLPRLLHYVLAGLGFSGGLAAWWAVRQARRGVEPGLNRRIAQHGWSWLLWTTVLQVVDGFLLLFLLPEPVLGAFMRGGAATMVPLGLSILGALGLLMMVSRVRDPVESMPTVQGTVIALALVIAVMTVTRHQVRMLYLEPATSLQPIATVAPQWLNFVLFVVLLVASLGTVAFMVRRVLTSPASGAEAA